MRHYSPTSSHIAALVAVTAATLLTSDLPTTTSTRFAGSGTCVACHEAGPGDALRDASGGDVSPVTLWRSAMMANAARDPSFRAKVAAEVSVFPSLQSVIEDKCTTCHTPMARTEAVLSGAPAYSMGEALADPLAMDAVSCTLCHQVSDTDLGEHESFSGGYVIGDDRIIFGPYDDAFSTFMEFTVNFPIAQAEHIQGSELCATCHTLFTPTIDYEGNLTGGEIAEQTPYLEWQNSIYADQETECQTCHMPELEEPVKISLVPEGVPERGPFSQHQFAGGNTLMMDIFRLNGEALGVTALTEHFDSTKARTLEQLQKHAANLEATASWVNGDSLQILVTVTNRAGHKLPTGFPSRRMWLYVRVCDPGGTVLFESGAWDPATGDLREEDYPFEAHRDVIRSADQVALYQSIMADVNGDPTWTLLRGAAYVKDNRIPPRGYQSTGPHTDVTAVIGEATTDPNFNKSGAAEGSGADQVTYRIGGLDGAPSYDVKVRLVYQSMAPSFVDDLFTYSLPEVEEFEGYYRAANPEPVVMKALTFSVSAVGIEDAQVGRFGRTPDLQLFPSPARSRVFVAFSHPSPGPFRLTVFDVSGRRVMHLSGYRDAGRQVELLDVNGLAAGTYVCRIDVGDESDATDLVIVR